MTWRLFFNLLMLHVLQLEYDGIQIVCNQPSDCLVNRSRSDSHLNKKIINNDGHCSFRRLVIFLTFHHTAPSPIIMSRKYNHSPTVFLYILHSSLGSLGYETIKPFKVLCSPPFLEGALARPNIDLPQLINDQVICELNLSPYIK